MIERASAFWIVEPGRCELRSETLPSPAAGEVLVRALFSAVSRGTESLVFNGRVPVSEYSRMRCPYQVGDFPGPVKYGYSNVGRVESGGQELLGRAVFCLYPHQSAYVVSAQAVLPLPEGMPPERAVLAANMETAINAVWDAAPRLGDRVTVIGAGVVGCLCAYLLARHPGVAVELVDLRAERADIARAFGVSFALPQAAQRERDLVVHASGSEAGLRTSLSLAGSGASVLELSWFGATEVSLPLGAAFHARRLSLQASQVGTLSPRARARFDHRTRLALALELCNDPLLDRLFDEEIRFDSLPEAMPQLTLPQSGSLCQRLRYDP
ncbi:MAG TPA: zinc-binding alcohol dehydrogenase [Polyangiaceae bacterium]|nr:zinc-binding alcohol dehydrogenase [Polyangiaceae bacterium]